MDEEIARVLKAARTLFGSDRAVIHVEEGNSGRLEWSIEVDSETTYTEEEAQDRRLPGLANEVRTAEGEGATLQEAYDDLARLKSAGAFDWFKPFYP